MLRFPSTRWTCGIQYAIWHPTSYWANHVFRKAKDLDNLSKLGHFLKGSSASIGLVAVSKSCAKMQNYGHLKDEAGTGSISAEEATEKIEQLLVTLKDEQKQAKKWLMDYYKEEW